MNLTDDYLKLLLAEKLGYAEIEVCFFTYCNLRCSFCFQDTKDTTGLGDISGKADLTLKWLKETGYGPDTRISLLGGELFQNQLDYYAQYKDFVQKVREVYPNIEINFISNLQFSKDTCAKVKELLQSTNTTISSSYDFSGRPMVSDIFIDNLEELKSFMAGVTFILTKPVCEKILSGKYHNDTFSYLYDNIKLHFDFYTPNKYAATLMPTDRLLYETISALHKDYPMLPQLQAWTSGKNNEMSCKSLKKVVILPDGSTHCCKYSKEYTQDEFRTTIDYNSNAGIISSLLDKNNCLSCEFIGRCPLGCSLMQDHVTYITELPLCFMKKLFLDWETDGINNKADAKVQL